MIDKIYTLWCDEKDCFQWYSDPFATKEELLKMAKEIGWKRINKKHFCPNCAKKGINHES